MGRPISFKDEPTRVLTARAAFLDLLFCVQSGQPPNRRQQERIQAGWDAVKTPEDTDLRFYDKDAFKPKIILPVGPSAQMPHPHHNSRS